MAKQPQPAPSGDDPYLHWIAKLLKAINEQNAQIETLRILLVKRGVFSDADYAAELVETQRDLTNQFSEMVSKALTEAEHAALLRLLDSHQSKPQ